MSASKTPSPRDTRDSPKAADAAFNKHTDAVREALSNFKAISFLNSTGPAKTAMEELIEITVRILFLSS